MPYKLQEILNLVKETLTKSNPDYDIVIKRVHLYYDMKLITLVEAWYSLEQYIGLKEDKLSSTTVDFIRSEGNMETKRLYWFSKPKMC